MDDCYLSWDDDGLVLVCERTACWVMYHGKPVYWTERLEGMVLPEYAVIQRAKHLATHIEVS